MIFLKFKMKRLFILAVSVLCLSLFAILPEGHCQSTGKGQAAVSNEEDELIESIRDRFDALIRTWKRLREIFREEAGSGQQAGATQEPDWAKDIKEKLDKTIEAMKVIEEELKELEEKGNR